MGGNDLLPEEEMVQSLRWAVNQDDDIWLARRGTRHMQRCSQCSSKGDSFASGHTVAPICERCIQAHQITPVSHCPFSADLLQACHVHFHTSGTPMVTPTERDQVHNVMNQFQEAQSRPALFCAP